jgi:hypothetical protein
LAAKEAMDIDLQSSRDEPISSANMPIKMAANTIKMLVSDVNGRLVEKDPDYTMRS